MSASLIRKSLNGGSLCFPPSHFSIRRLYIAISVSHFIYLFAYSITLQAQQNRNKKLIILSFKIKKSSVFSHWILFYPYFTSFHLFPPCLCYVSVMLILLFLLLFLLLFYYTLYYILNSNSAFLISAQLYEAI